MSEWMGRIVLGSLVMGMAAEEMRGNIAQMGRAVWECLLTGRR